MQNWQPCLFCSIVFFCSCLLHVIAVADRETQNNLGQTDCRLQQFWAARFTACYYVERFLLGRYDKTVIFTTVPKPPQLRKSPKIIPNFRAKVTALVALGLSALILGLYVFTILWRVSVAEKRLYGSSRLIPLSWHKQVPYKQGNASTFDEFTCPYNRNGKTIHVYKQLVNSFQHAYGSALAAYELSEVPADLLFRANEYTEAIFSSASGTQNWYLDTKKDLHNNAVGREIGLRARRLGLNGLDAEKYMIVETLKAADDGRIYNHFLDKRTLKLPTLEEFGCPGLFQILNLRSTTPLIR